MHVRCMRKAKISQVILMIGRFRFNRIRDTILEFEKINLWDTGP